MFDPDILIIAGIKKLGILIYKSITSLISPFTITIGGIPIFAIVLLILLWKFIEIWYMYDKTNGGEMSTKIQSIISSSKFVKWFMIGTFSLMGLILAI